MDRREFLGYALASVFDSMLPSFGYGDEVESLSRVRLDVLRVFPGLLEWLAIDGGRQKMYLLREGKVYPEYVKSYFVSTSRKGFGNLRGSHKTPIGLHKIFLKKGDTEPVGTVFDKWQKTNKIVRIEDVPSKGKAVVTTRMMSLRGCEPRNYSTDLRGIHIHGTNKEWSIGSPYSGGCIRMMNQDVIDLYDRVNVGTPVYIARKLEL